MQLKHRPFLLIIMDGWGYTDITVYNAIHSAHKPNWDSFWSEYPHQLISASGIEVGLPSNQMGNSEVGHMNIGSGRVVHQEFTRISEALENGSFFQNKTLQESFDKASYNNKAVHILGLLSDGGVHSHEDHIFALMEMAAHRGVEKIYLHAFLDGRDTPPRSATESIARAQVKFHEIGKGKIVSMIGRHYAMDRNKHWDRTQAAYDLISEGKADYVAPDPFVALDMAYDRDETDEFVNPVSIHRQEEPPVRVEDGDVMIFANYRADRARQLARAFTKKDFKSFTRHYFPRLGSFTSLTEYKSNYEFPVAFRPEHLKNVLGEYISRHGLKQLRIAETEKYAHVTFFFNGGEEQVFPGEDRLLVPSPHVRTYDERPEMSAYEITEQLIKAIVSDKYDLIVCNFANTDMVGHTGDFQAAISAVEVVDTCLGKIVAAMQKAGGETLITADHGNAEQMRAYTTEKIKAQAHTAHTSNFVPLLYIGRPAELVPREGVLADVSPTLLYLMALKQPEEMTGQPLFKLKDE